MSLLQDPLKALDQIEWYLNNEHLESFPGAFLLAAGNLSRQVLEQILFILAFYSRTPESKYMKRTRELRTAYEILRALRETNPSSGRTYFEEARRRGPRIRKFARYPRSLEKWRKELNEPSHFRNPAARRRTRDEHIRAFVQRMRTLLDPLDSYLITAAVNELRTKGKVRAVLGNDANNTPGVQVDTPVSYRNLRRNNGGLSLSTPQFPIRVIPNDREVPWRGTRSVVLLQHSAGMSINARMYREDGGPLDLSGIEALLRSFADTPENARRLVRHLRRLGLKVELLEK